MESMGRPVATHLTDPAQRSPPVADFIIGRIGAAVVWFPSRVPLYRLSK
jgi:hypothetical protein